MNLQVAGKHALVTGSTAGIGYAIARALAAEGARVAVNGRDEGGTHSAVERLRRELGASADVHACAADLADAAGCARMVEQCADVDILVNNLGIFEPVLFEQIDDDAWQHLFDVNVMSGVRLSRYYLPRMKAAGWGRIVFISSESGLCPPAEMVHYGTSKTAQLSLARGLAETTSGTDVTVNAVLPGPTRTEGVDAFFGQLAAERSQTVDEAIAGFFARDRPTSILQRLIEPAEVAALVAFVCSPLAGAINGAAMRVEGGVVRCIG